MINNIIDHLSLQRRCDHLCLLVQCSGKIGLLSSMYTNPAYRRQGIARKLLDHVVEEARTYGCGAVWITASEMGVLLYTAYGFEKNGRFLQYTLS